MIDNLTKIPELFLFLIPSSACSPTNKQFKDNAISIWIYRYIIVTMEKTNRRHRPLLHTDIHSSALTLLGNDSSSKKKKKNRHSFWNYNVKNLEEKAENLKFFHFAIPWNCAKKKPNPCDEMLPNELQQVRWVPLYHAVIPDSFIKIHKNCYSFLYLFSFQCFGCFLFLRYLPDDRPIKSRNRTFPASLPFSLKKIIFSFNWITRWHWPWFIRYTI